MNGLTQGSALPTLQEHSYSDHPSSEDEDNYNNEVEQTQELLPLSNPVFEQSISPPKALDNNSFYHFPQPEVHILIHTIPS